MSRTLQASSKNINFTKLKKLIPMYVRAKRPVMLRGKPGIGKSEFTLYVAEPGILSEKGFHVEDIRLSQRTPTSIGGIPIIDRSDNSTCTAVMNGVTTATSSIPDFMLRSRAARYGMLVNDDDSVSSGKRVMTDSELLDWYVDFLSTEKANQSGKEVADAETVKEIREKVLDPNARATFIKTARDVRKKRYGKPTLFFFDELTSAQPVVAAAAYQIFNERRVGDFLMADDDIIIAAGNRQSDKGVVFNMPSPLANRMAHLDVEPDIDSWIAWAFRAGVHPAVIGFVKNTEVHLDAFDPDKYSDDPAFATPRTWEHFSSMLHEAEEAGIANDNSAIMTLGSSVIGEVMAQKFIKHYELSGKLPNVRDVLSGKYNRKQYEERKPDINFTFASQILSLCVKDYMDFRANPKEVKIKDRYKESVYNGLMLIVEQMPKDVATMVMTQILQERLLIIPADGKCAEIHKMIHDKFNKLIRQTAQMNQELGN